MSTRRGLVVAALISLASRGAHAQRALPAPRFERTVTPGAPGPNRLAVDSTLLVGGSPLETPYAGSSRAGLGELRLHDDVAGREVPYLFVWPSAATPRPWRGGSVTRVTPRPDTSGFELDLRAAYLVDRFDVDELPSGVLKRVRLEGSGDRVHWVVLVEDGTIVNLPADADGRSITIRQSTLAFAPAMVRYLRLTADDHAGAPLPVPRVASARLASRLPGDPDTLRSVLTFERRPSAQRTSRYHVTLPATRLPIAALELDVGGEQVLRNATVTEQRLENGRLQPVSLGNALLRRITRGGAVAANLRVPMGMPAGAEVDLVIDDGDNPPLDLRAVRAVYAPLPYIFFQSDSGRALRATYGSTRDSSIAPPRYDLEVLRDSVRTIAAAVAGWGPARAATTVAAQPTPPATLYADPGAPLDVKSFRVARDIPTGSGLTAVRLDAAALAHSRIEDVRIVDAEGRQVPYILETLGEPTVLSLAAPQPMKPRVDVDDRVLRGAASRTWYRVALPLAGLPDATLRLETSARVFDREIVVMTRELPRDARQLVADQVVDLPWRHDDPEAAASPVEIDLGSRRLTSDSLFVLVNDGDNQKLPLTRATLLLPTYRLRFYRPPGASLRLLYGRDDLASPRYDIALLAPRLLEAAAEEVAAEAEPSAKGVASTTPQRVFWAVLGVVVMALLALVARLLRAGPGPTPEDVPA